MISVIEYLAQAENDRKCYGYKHDKEGHLIIDEETAKNVKLIFDLYLGGQSVIGIIKELEFVDGDLLDSSGLIFCLRKGMEEIWLYQHLWSIMVPNKKKTSLIKKWQLLR